MWQTASAGVHGPALSHQLARNRLAYSRQAPVTRATFLLRCASVMWSSFEVMAERYEPERVRSLAERAMRLTERATAFSAGGKRAAWACLMERSLLAPRCES